MDHLAFLGLADAAAPAQLCPTSPDLGWEEFTREVMLGTIMFSQQNHIARPDILVKDFCWKLHTVTCKRRWEPVQHQ